MTDVATLPTNQPSSPLGVQTSGNDFSLTAGTLVALADAAPAGRSDLDPEGTLLAFRPPAASPSTTSAPAGGTTGTGAPVSPGGTVPLGIPTGGGGLPAAPYGLNGVTVTPETGQAIVERALKRGVGQDLLSVLRGHVPGSIIEAGNVLEKILGDKLRAGGITAEAINKLPEAKREELFLAVAQAADTYLKAGGALYPKATQALDAAIDDALIGAGLRKPREALTTMAPVMQNVGQTSTFNLQPQPGPTLPIGLGPTGKPSPVRVDGNGFDGAPLGGQPYSMPSGVNPSNPLNVPLTIGQTGQTGGSPVRIGDTFSGGPLTGGADPMPPAPALPAVTLPPDPLAPLAKAHGTLLDRFMALKLDYDSQVAFEQGKRLTPEQAKALGGDVRRYEAALAADPLRANTAPALELAPAKAALKGFESTKGAQTGGVYDPFLPGAAEEFLKLYPDVPLQQWIRETSGPLGGGEAELERRLRDWAGDDPAKQMAVEGLLAKRKQPVGPTNGVPSSTGGSGGANNTGGTTPTGGAQEPEGTQPQLSVRAVGSNSSFKENVVDFLRMNAENNIGSAGDVAGTPEQAEFNLDKQIAAEEILDLMGRLDDPRVRVVATMGPTGHGVEAVAGGVLLDDGTMLVKGVIARNHGTGAGFEALKKLYDDSPTGKLRLEAMPGALGYYLSIGGKVVDDQGDDDPVKTVEWTSRPAKGAAPAPGSEAEPPIAQPAPAAPVDWGLQPPMGNAAFVMLDASQAMQIRPDAAQIWPGLADLARRSPDEALQLDLDSGELEGAGVTLKPVPPPNPANLTRTQTDALAAGTGKTSAQVGRFMDAVGALFGGGGASAEYRASDAPAGSNASESRILSPEDVLNELLPFFGPITLSANTDPQSRDVTLSLAEDGTPVLNHPSGPLSDELRAALDDVVSSQGTVPTMRVDERLMPIDAVVTLDPDGRLVIHHAKEGIHQDIVETLKNLAIMGGPPVLERVFALGGTGTSMPEVTQLVSQFLRELAPAGFDAEASFEVLGRGDNEVEVLRALTIGAGGRGNAKHVFGHVPIDRPEEVTSRASPHTHTPFGDSLQDITVNNYSGLSRSDLNTAQAAAYELAGIKGWEAGSFSEYFGMFPNLRESFAVSVESTSGTITQRGYARVFNTFLPLDQEVRPTFPEIGVSDEVYDGSTTHAVTDQPTFPLSQYFHEATFDQGLFQVRLNRASSPEPIGNDKSMILTADQLRQVVPSAESTWPGLPNGKELLHVDLTTGTVSTDDGREIKSNLGTPPAPSAADAATLRQGPKTPEQQAAYFEAVKRIFSPPGVVGDDKALSLDVGKLREEFPQADELWPGLPAAGDPAATRVRIDLETGKLSLPDGSEIAPRKPIRQPDEVERRNLAAGPGTAAQPDWLRNLVYFATVKGLFGFE